MITDESATTYLMRWEIFLRGGQSVKYCLTWAVIIVFLASCSSLYYAPLNSNETSMHVQEGRLCHLQHQKRGILGGLSGDEKGAHHRRESGAHSRRVLLTSKKWRLLSGCNHSTAYVDQSKR